MSPAARPLQEEHAESWKVRKRRELGEASLALGAVEKNERQSAQQIAIPAEAG